VYSDWFKYINKGSELDGNIYTCSDRPYNQCFFRPHIGIRRELSPHDIHVITHGRDEHDDLAGEQGFDIRVWNLVIRSKHRRLGRTADECRVRIRWDFIQQLNDLVWKDRDEPEECNININPLKDNGFSQRLAYSYNETLRHIGKDNLTLPPDYSHEVYLLLTISGHDVAYLIINDPDQFASWDTNRNIFVDRSNNRFLYIPFNESYNFMIRFDWKGHVAGNYHRYRITVKSWNNIEFSKT
jgi:hypothetical protein